LGVGRRKRKKGKPKRNKTFREQWRERYPTYADYLKSEDWQRAKKRHLAARVVPDVCFGCGGERAVFHHLTYDRVGRELPTDILPLCRLCHETVHGPAAESAKVYGWDGWELVENLFGRRPPSVGESRGKRRRPAFVDKIDRLRGLCEYCGVRKGKLKCLGPKSVPWSRLTEDDFSFSCAKCSHRRPAVQEMDAHLDAVARGA
jgi:hypothetical protein